MYLVAFLQRTNLAQQLRVLVCGVCLLTNTSATTAIHSMNPLPHINNELSSLSNELHDLIDSHLTTLTQEHASTFDPSHPHSLLLRVLHQQFIEHVEQQLLNLRQYTTNCWDRTSVKTDAKNFVVKIMNGRMRKDKLSRRRRTIQISY